MKKTYTLTDLDCANCAAKIERGINKIDGVKEATVNFMTLKLIMEIDDAVNADDVFKKALREVKKVEPDCDLV